MTHRIDRSTISRRKIIQTASVAPLGVAMLGRALIGDDRDTLSASGRKYRIEGIDVENVVDEYAARELDAVSDHHLYRQSAEIIANPPNKRSTSFTLHAPLELMARYGLLSLVEPKERSLARLQLVTTAAAYASGVEPTTVRESDRAFSSFATAKIDFAQAFRARDADGLELLTLRIAAQFGTASLVHLLTPVALPTLTGASHSHIGLWLLMRHGTASSSNDAALLRTAVRHLAGKPNDQLKSFGGLRIDGGKPLSMSEGEIEADILGKLTDPPKGRSRSSSMRPLLEAGESTGNADSLFGEFIGHDLTSNQMDAAFRAVLRVCAHSMLQDSIGEAKFGWSHCLTLPQAACGLSSLNMHRKLGLATTLVWTTAYRSVLSKRSLDFAWKPEKLREPSSVAEALHASPETAAARVWHADRTEWSQIQQTLATQASIRNDQHLVKYTRACFDAASFDPGHTRLYFAAAAYLCAHWIQERPYGQIRDNLLVRRKWF